MKKVYQITAEGRDDLQKELFELKERRSEISERIAAARDYGDLSENAEYDAAREEQGIVETRVLEIENILANFELIKPKSGGVVRVGSTVDLHNGKIVTYTVVGPVEANPLEGKISNESPIGAALMGKKTGDTVTIITPKGEVTYTIDNVR